jgi:protein TonB
MDTNMVLNASFNELVFENRHKDYGAYQIRKRYSKNVVISAFLAVAFFTTALGAYFVNLPDANAAGVPPNGPPKIADTVTVNMLDERKTPIKKQREVLPPAAKGSTNTITENIKIVTDSATSLNVNDTAGTPTGETGGVTKIADTTSTTGQPCVNCGDTVPPKPRLVQWLIDPPKDPGLDEFFKKNIRYPQLAKDRGIQGVVYLTFIVDTKGDVRDIKIAKGADPLLDREVLRVAKFMPKWEPVKDENGEIVEYQYNKPVRFTLK